MKILAPLQVFNQVSTLKFKDLDATLEQVQREIEWLKSEIRNIKENKDGINNI